MPGTSRMPVSLREITQDIEKLLEAFHVTDMPTDEANVYRDTAECVISLYVALVRKMGDTILQRIVFTMAVRMKSRGNARGWRAIGPRTLRSNTRRVGIHRTSVVEPWPQFQQPRCPPLQYKRDLQYDATTVFVGYGVAAKGRGRRNRNNHLAERRPTPDSTKD
ncbi:hypothetical protein O1611_g312 [Lasiodiplodia mahajangana]|uniref:Uncharacterized protein n=1 Tax=Lasiodiplodia mahajangana TaxID=1108764 RepID=A0ACC2K0X8_9PEZI|nr:hypothetical protein O1611_g312 [Lasiodiplodia mahajangana]